MARGIKTGGGSRKGRPNKKNMELREAARGYTPEALSTLAQIMRVGESEQARVSAANSLLDRGWGKAHQHIETTIDQTVTITDERVKEANRLLAEAVDKLADEPAQSSAVVH